MSVKQGGKNFKKMTSILLEDEQKQDIFWIILFDSILIC